MELFPGKQLFIDDYFIESLHGGHRVFNSAAKQTQDTPLDMPPGVKWNTGQSLPGRMAYDEKNQSFRLYYQSTVEGQQRICALDSADGVTWESPRLGLVQHNGSGANNMTNCPPGGLTIFWDPNATDEKYRWKRIDNAPTGTGAKGEKIWRAFHSADGYDWQEYPEGPHNTQQMLFNFGSPAPTFGGSIDPDAGYVFYSQRGSDRRTRVLGRRDSADALSWSGLRTVIDPDLEDTPGTEFYASASDIANRTQGGLHLLMLNTFLSNINEPYRIEEPKEYWGTEQGGVKALAARVDGLVDTQFAASRDTVSWRRWRQPVIKRGTPGAWDWGAVYADAPILHNGKLYIFYNGNNLTHNGRTAQLWQKPYASPGRWGKGLALLRPDGFVSIEAQSYAPAVLTTHRFRQEEGGRIWVNVDASAGELRYEVLEDTGETIPGYSAAECDPIRTDASDAELSWNGKPGWPPLSAQRRSRLSGTPDNDIYIKLRFHIAPGTKLYSLRLDPPEAALWQVRLKGRID
jgi:hypothetical protein